MSLVEAIAKQAQSTFSRTLTDETFSENITKLIRSVARVRSADLKLSKDSLRTIPTDSDDDGGKRPAPVTYIEVAENQTFSIGIFVLNFPGARIPLHDHPGMFGILKVLQGSVKVSSFSALPKSDSKLPRDINNRVKGVHRDLLVPVEKHPPATLTDKDDPCVLRPKEGNFHEIVAVGGTAAFLDILAPPYDMKERDCHYYVPMETNKADSEVKAWLLRTPPPSDFWCEAAPYTGPKFTL